MDEPIIARFWPLEREPLLLPSPVINLAPEQRTQGLAEALQDVLRHSTNDVAMIAFTDEVVIVAKGEASEHLQAQVRAMRGKVVP